jgi:hypothetical protein
MEESSITKKKKNKKKKKTKMEEWGCISVVECLTSMCKVLGLILSTTEISFNES